METITILLQEFLGTDVRFHPVYLLPFFLMALALFVLRDRAEHKTGFWRWFFPKEIYTHPSHIVDLKLFVLGRFLVVTKAFNIIFVQAAFALIGMGVVGLLTGMEASVAEATIARVVIATLIITVVSDFCVYWVHRIHHEAPAIWPFHSVHHSAEVMTPVTVYRKHPVYDLISDFTKSVLTGFVQGVILMLLIGKVQLSLLAGINAFYFIFNFTGSNFRHSHIWISYGKFLEHVFISPAQHQIHHSLEPKHHNKNYGEIFSLWDWFFGTLYLAGKREVLSFGISKSSQSNERIAQPHIGLKSAIAVPFQDSWKAIRRRMK